MQNKINDYNEFMFNPKMTEKTYKRYINIAKNT